MYLKFGLFYFLFLIGRNPTQDRIARFRAFLLQHGFFRHCLQFLESSEAGRELLEERHLFDESQLNLTALRALPPQTLGGQFARFIDENGFDPLYYPMQDIQSAEDFIGRRYLQTHDVWHVVLGYKSDVLGEIELLAFAYAQFRWPIAPFLLTGFLFRNMFASPLQLPSFLEAVMKGWQRGCENPALLPIRWEDFWEMPLDDVRRLVGVR